MVKRSYQNIDLVSFTVQNQLVKKLLAVKSGRLFWKQGTVSIKIMKATELF